MKSPITETGHSTFGRQHMAAAVTAVLLSLGLHATLLWQIPRLRIRSSRLFQRPTETFEATEPTRLFDILRERRLAPDRDRPDMLGETPAVEWTKTLDALGIEPEAAAMEAPPPDDSWLAEGEDKIRTPDATPQAGAWQPRREIMVIEQAVVQDDVATIPRRRTARIERVGDAPDIVAPFDREQAGSAHALGAGTGSADTPARAKIDRPTVVTTDAPDTADHITPDATREKAETLAREDDRVAQPYRPIETMLKARVETYTRFWDRRHKYFKIEVESMGDDVLPTTPKDIVFVQHSSARMSETILKFCRVGLSNSVTRLGPDDRFNIVTMRDTVDWCFSGWTPNTPETMAQAQAYIAGMRSEGNTDIYSAMESLLTLERQPGRPMIAVLITEGHPTAGITASTDVIGRFTRANNGRIAVYGLGITQTSNTYLLDLLSFSNRGEASWVTRGRWEIPDAMLNLVDSISRPVLTDVRFVFSDASQAEVYPAQPTPLYKDRPLTLYGRAPREANRIVFQAVGRAGDTEYDMIFDLSLDETGEAGDRDLRQAWAEQKVYRLISDYARRRDPALLETLRETARSYRIRVPYQDRL